MVSEMTQVLIEGRCTPEHERHLIVSWVGIKDQNMASHQVGTRHKCTLTSVAAEVSNDGSG